VLPNLHESSTGPFLVPVTALVVEEAQFLLKSGLRWPAENANESSAGFLDGRSLENFEWPRGIRARACSFAIMCAVAVFTIDVLYLSPRGLALYNSGLRLVNADHNPTYLVFMAGQLDHRFHSYLAVSYLLKEPLAGIILFGIGLYELRRTKTLSLLRQLFVLSRSRSCLPHIRPGPTTPASGISCRFFRSFI
jgi:hypothetical protein